MAPNPELFKNADNYNKVKQFVVDLRLQDVPLRLLYGRAKAELGFKLGRVTVERMLEEAGVPEQSNRAKTGEMALAKFKKIQDIAITEFSTGKYSLRELGNHIRSLGYSIGSDKLKKLMQEGGLDVEQVKRIPKRRYYKRYLPDYEIIEKKVCELFADGTWSANRLADYIRTELKLKVGGNTVVHMLRDNGFEIRKQRFNKLPDIKTDKIIALFDSGKGIREIYRETSTSRTTVRNVLIKFDRIKVDKKGKSRPVDHPVNDDSAPVWSETALYNMFVKKLDAANTAFALAMAGRQYEDARLRIR